MSGSFQNSPQNQSELFANRYQLLQLLGKGGSGQVFRALDTKFVPPRQVAVKILHPQVIVEQGVREEIYREAGALARFNHPYILPVLDFEVNHEQAYIVMALGEGGSLSDKIRPNPGPSPVPLAQVVIYLEQIAAALDEAHAQGLIHRDLKPANVLLDKNGRVMLGDFGLAATLSASKSSMLMENSSSGTPLYMAPEQWNGQTGKASDIYALGIMTYQLITGFPPFIGNAQALAHQHLNMPLPRLAEKQPGFSYPPALDALLAEATAKDRQRRIKTAGEFARRFKSIVEGRGDPAAPIPQTPTAPLLQPQPGQPMPYPVEYPTNQALAGQSPPQMGAGNYSPMTQYSPVSAGNPTQAPAPNPKSGNIFKKPITWIGAIAMLLVGVIIGVLVLNAFGSRVTIINNVTNININSPVIAISYSPDGKTLVSGSKDGAVRFLDATTGAILKLIQNKPDSVTALTFSPDGQKLAIGNADSTIQLFEVATTRPLVTLKGHTAAIKAVTFSPDSRKIASGSADKTLKIWDANSGSVILTLSGHEDSVNSVSFDNGGNTVASGSSDKTVRVWDITQQTVNTARTIIKGYAEAINSVVFSPDGKTVAGGSKDKTIKLWDVTGNDAREVLNLKDSEGEINSVAFRTDGKTIAGGGSDRTIRMWEVASGRQVSMVKGFNEPVTSVSFSPDGQKITGGSTDQTIKIGDLQNVLEPIPPQQPPTAVRTTAAATVNALQVSAYTGGRKVVTMGWSPDSQKILTGNFDGMARIWGTNGTTLLRMTTTPNVSGEVFAAWSPDGKTIASAYFDRIIKFWSADGKELASGQGHSGAITGLEWSPDGKTLATISNDKTALLWDTTAKPLQTLRGHSSFVWHLAWSPDGKYLATGGSGGEVKIFDTSGKLVGEYTDSDNGSVPLIRWSPNGKYLAVSLKNIVLLGPDGKVSKELKLTAGGDYSMAWSPDSKFLAAGATFGLDIWDLETEKSVYFKPSDSSRNTLFKAMKWSPDGKYLAAGAGDGYVWLLTAQGQVAASLKGPTGNVTQVAFSPDNNKLASGSEDGSVYIWQFRGGL